MNGFGICENPDILRIIYFIKVLINVVKFLIPMGLIIMVSLDIGKGVISGENDFGKILKASGNRILSAMIIFLLPTIVNFVLVFVDETTSYESCWANANSTTIDSYQVLWDEAKKKEEEKIEEESKKEEEKIEEESKKEEEKIEEESKKEEEKIEEEKKQEFITSSSDITFSYQYIENSNYLPYALYTPSTAKTNETTPLIVWLHGSGEVGSSENHFKNSGLPKVLNNWKLEGFNAYVLCPHLRGSGSPGSWQSSSSAQKLYQLIDKFIKENNINTNKIILTGHSLGGIGVLYMAYQRLDFYSALVVLSGYNPGVDITMLKTIPIRGYSEPIDFMQNKFKNTFGNENYYPLNTSHGNVPNMAFNLDENHDNKSDLVEWMLTQEKR